VILPFKKKKANKRIIKVHVVEAPGTYGSSIYRAWVACDPFMEVCRKPMDADVLLFTGGADVSPQIYGQPPHKRTHCDVNRDNYETALFAIGKDKLKVGICRGAQLLNVLSGGSMLQHVSGHTSSHDLVLLHEKNAIMRDVPSTHHQMMLPSPHVHTRSILATAYKDGKQCIASPMEKEVPTEMMRERWKFLEKYKSKDFNPFQMDAEILYYYNTNSLCIQSHPEKRKCPSQFTAYCNNLIVTLAERHIKRLAEAS